MSNELDNKMKARLATMMAAAALSYGALALTPAQAAGGIYGSGAITSGCSGGVVTVGATNTNSNNWVFNVTAVCGNALPHNVVIAGSWNAATGGVVTGFGSGSLQVAKVDCGSNYSVAVQIAMTGSPLVKATATLTRSCF